MSSRITRAAARRAQEQATSAEASPVDSAPPSAATASTSSNHPHATPTPTSRRKRKAPESPVRAALSSPSAAAVAATGTLSRSSSGSTRQSSKRRRVETSSGTARAATSAGRGRGQPIMASEDQPGSPTDTGAPAKTDTPSRKKNTRSRKSDPAAFDSPAPSRSSVTRRRKGEARTDEETPDMPDTPSAPAARRVKPGKGARPDVEDQEMDYSEEDSESIEDEGEEGDEGEGDAEGNEEDEDEDEDEDGEDRDPGDDELDEDEQVRNTFLSRLGAAGGFSASRLFGGLMTGSATTNRLREMLEGLKAEDPSLQMVALQDLSSFLLISTEDNLAGHFSPDSFVRELVKLMQPNEITGEINEEMELMACRCIANLMEALPQATASVVYGGAIPVICGKLLMINSIEVAEQALTTLEKISVEFPSHIVKEGGLSACLGFLDFFPTGTQRSAVTTVANSCRNIPDECFQTVKDVMPILENTLNNADQKVVEQASLSVCRISESFKNRGEKLEQLVSENLLRAILRLLMPGSTSLIPADIHTKFLRVLAFTARSSPAHSASLIKMDVVDTLYQILTGVSPPPPESEDIVAHIDGVVIMQALIRKQREQIYETLNVICELLPGLASETSFLKDDTLPSDPSSHLSIETVTRGDLLPKSADPTRRELLGQHKAKLRRFATIMLPTLTHAYTSTVNLSVRQKVLTNQLKMLSNFDVDILEGALKSVPLASHLASILSQQDHPILVLLALQAARLLFDRLGHIYAYQFCREGVLSEIQKLAGRPLQAEEPKQRPSSTAPSVESPVSNPVPQVDSNDEHSAHADEEDEGDEAEEGGDLEDDDDEDDEGADGEDDDDDDAHARVLDDEITPSPSDSTVSDAAERDVPARSAFQDVITREAKRFVEAFEKTKNNKAKSQATAVLEAVRAVAKDLQECYSGEDFKSGPASFRKLAKYFGGDALESITSAELLGSDLIDALLEIFTSPDEGAAASKSSFLHIFTDDKVHGAYGAGGTNAGTPSPFSALVHKLQDLLSRAEHFEVITVHSNGHESNRHNAASMLAKQLRLKLVADGDSDIPRAYRNIMVSIHAIATFKALDDYLRPRLSLGDRPRGLPRGSDLLSSLASAGIPPEARQRLVESGFMGSLAGMAPPMPPMPSAASSSENRRQSRRKSSRPEGAGVSETTPGMETPPPPPPQSQPSEGPPSLRRTARASRSHRGSHGNKTPPPLPPAAPSATGDTLECADERQLVDDENEGNEDKGENDNKKTKGTEGGNPPARPTLADVAGNEQAERGDTPDPSAVNMEVASSGKVTARQEDGTRIPTPNRTATNTPSQSDSPSQSRTRAAGPSSSSSNPAAMSYAAAIRATPQDWHIEFSIDGQAINNETTIYRAVHYRPNQQDEPASRSLWSNVHPITFKRVPGPPSESTTLSPPPEAGSSSESAGALPASLHKNPLTSKILRLLNILHEMNTDMDTVLDGQKGFVKTKSEPASLFVNTKLTAKLNRQLEEPLIVASNCLPGWSEDLARLYPFLFPFETRHLFLQSTSFGYSRSMTRWQSNQTETSRRSRHRDERPFLGRLQRQKVRISRSRILESAVKVMELYGASPSMLEVEYFEEVGTGLGPTLEFYSTVSKEFSKKKSKLWRENEATGEEYAFGKHGLFPAPLGEDQVNTENGRRVLHLFGMMGKFVARAMLDSRIIDISFNPMFFRYSCDSEDTLHDAAPSSMTTSSGLGLAAIKQIDADLYKSLKVISQFVTQKKRIDEDARLTEAQKIAKLERIEVHGAGISDLGLDFTLPGHESIELSENGSETPVDIDNVEEYLELVVDATVGKGVRRQISAFRDGFSQVFPYSALRAFTPAELVMLFGRNEEDWSMETLTDSIKADHGYNMDSKTVRNLLDCLSHFTEAQRRDFLQFVTGSPKLPIGGFKALVPMFTVVCKPAEKPLTSDDYLPSVMTCVNYLKLPDYSDVDTMRERLLVAIKEGQGAFHLS